MIDVEFGVIRLWVMIRALMLSITCLRDRRLMAIWVKTVLLTMAAFAILGIVVWFGLDMFFVKMGWNAADGTGGWWSAIVALSITILAGILVFRMVAIAILWMFSDDIVDVVEDYHYRELGLSDARPGVGKSLHMAMRSVLRVLGYNLIASPLYIGLLITGFGTALMFLFINALLLGRDLEDMLVARHGTEYASMGKIDRFILGMAGTAGMMVPFANLLVPVLAIATAVHMVHLPEHGRKRGGND